MVEAATLALKAGIDIDMMSGAYEEGLPLALERGLVTIEEIDEETCRESEHRAIGRRPDRPSHRHDVALDEGP